MNKIFFIFVLLVSLSLLWASIKKDQHRKGHDFQTISIECAASMKKPLEEIRNTYQRENDVFIKVNYGGSGKLLGSGDLPTELSEMLPKFDQHQSNIEDAGEALGNIIGTN